MIEERLKSDRVFLKSFAETMSAVYHPIQVSHYLGLASHPTLVQAFGGQSLLLSTKMHDKIVKEVVYRLDDHA